MDRWEMVYSTTRHGTSINTFYTKVYERAPTIIVVLDSNRHVCSSLAIVPYNYRNILDFWWLCFWGMDKNEAGSLWLWRELFIQNKTCEQGLNMLQ